VAVADHTGGVANDGGLDVPALDAWTNEHGGVAGFPGGEAFENKEIIGWEMRRVREGTRKKRIEVGMTTERYQSGVKLDKVQVGMRKSRKYMGLEPQKVQCGVRKVRYQAGTKIERKTVGTTVACRSVKCCAETVRSR